MRNYDQATSNYLASRQGVIAKLLIWIKAVDLATQAPIQYGFWSGDEDLTFSIGGESRQYIGAGAILQSDMLESASGLDVRMHRVRLSAVAPELEDAVKGYNLRFKPIEVHRVFLDLNSRALVAPPHRVVKGTVNHIDFPRAVTGETASCDLEIAGQTRVLTKTLPVKKSDASQRARSNCRFRRYSDISGGVPVYWGELREEI
jgi:hypothetical protein